MNKPKLDIYKFLVINRLIVLALLVAFAFFSIVFGVAINRLYSKQLNTVLVLDSEGDVVPMKWMDRLENIHIEVKHHLTLFHTYFYGYDSFSVEKNTEKALWLGDNTVEQLYIKRSNDGWYNRVQMFDIKQSIEINPMDITIEGTDEPFNFRVKAKLTIEQGNQVSEYLFETIGTVIMVNRNYPLNPHGLLITNYNEVNRQQIK
jgi:hypothetical protein